MSDPYQRLLDATIEHLQHLREQGIHFVSISPERLPQLRSPSLKRSPQPSAQPEPKPAWGSAPELLPLSSTDGSTQIGKGTVAGDALEPAAKAAAFAELRERVMVCVKCAHLASSRRNVVFGVGDINARLMFIGEAPGADEDQQGEPFVGKAGQLLTRIIQTMGLTRNSVYIANILKCRPDTPGQSAGNRKPTAEEMQTCIPYLHQQIDLIQPRVIVGLGGTAIEGLLGKTSGIMRLRGHWHSYRGIPLMPTYHPAYLLRNQALSEKRRVWEDMLQVMEKLQLPISEKQRNFFLSPGM
jgi:DNA polymerase